MIFVYIVLEVNLALLLMLLKFPMNKARTKALSWLGLTHFVFPLLVAAWFEFFDFSVIFEKPTHYGFNDFNSRIHFVGVTFHNEITESTHSLHLHQDMNLITAFFESNAVLGQNVQLSSKWNRAFCRLPCSKKIKLFQKPFCISLVRHNWHYNFSILSFSEK